jgi:hypothetical protein
VNYARRALDWYIEHGSPADIVRGAQVLGRAYVDSDEPVDAVEAMVPYFDADRAGEPEMMALGADLATAQMRSFRNQESADVALAVLMAAEAAGNSEVAIDAMNTRGTVLGGLERIYESTALLREALRLAEQHALPYQTLRALNNLMTVESVNGIAGLRDAWVRGYELAPRVMDGGLLVRMAGNHATGLLEDGEFDEAITTLDELDLGESVWADFFVTRIEQIRWIQTGDPAHIERARQANDPLLKHPEPQYHSVAMDTEIGLLWMEGRLDEVIELAPQVVPAQPYHGFRHTAIAAAIRLGDPGKVRAAIDLIELPIGRRYDVLRFAGDTGLELLEGDADRAAAMFVELVEQLTEVESPRFAAEWKAIFAEVMPDRPEANAAAKEAYDWFSKVGAQGYLDYYSDVWEQQLGEEAAAAG